MTQENKLRAFTLEREPKIYVYGYPVHMSCGFPKLRRIVKQELKKEVERGDLYLFVNTLKNYIKVLFWSNNGYCIMQKKLPVGNFEVEFKKNKIFTLEDLQHVVDHVTIKGIE